MRATIVYSEIPPLYQSCVILFRWQCVIDIFLFQAQEWGHLLFWNCISVCCTLYLVFVPALFSFMLISFLLQHCNPQKNDMNLTFQPKKKRMKSIRKLWSLLKNTRIVLLQVDCVYSWTNPITKASLFDFWASQNMAAFTEKEREASWEDKWKWRQKVTPM